MFVHFTDKHFINRPDTYARCEDSFKLGEYSTLELAQLSCMINDKCRSITDYQCNGGFWTCKDGHLKESTEGSCSWLKMEGTLALSKIEMFLIN